MKKLTRERVVRTVSASVSWLIFAMIGSGLEAAFPIADRAVMLWFDGMGVRVAPCDGRRQVGNGSTNWPAERTHRDQALEFSEGTAARCS